MVKEEKKGGRETRILSDIEGSRRTGGGLQSGYGVITDQKGSAGKIGF